MLIIGRYNVKGQDWFNMYVDRNNIDKFQQFIKWSKITYGNNSQNSKNGKRYKVVVKKRTIKVYEYGELLVKYKLVAED